MKISVIIPAKNEAILLPRLLRSIAAQTYLDREVIVADAFSSDGTRSVAVAHGARVIDGGMPGPGRNLGAQAATGALFLFLDADTVLPSERFLEDVVREFREQRADVATCKLEPLTDRADDRFGHDVYNYFVQLTQGTRPHAPGGCLLVTREAHERIGGFDERVLMIEDCDYVQRAHRSGFRFRQLRSHPILVSVRRLDKDGRWRIAAKYLYSEFYMMTVGPFRHQPYRYDMGGDQNSSHADHS